MDDAYEKVQKCHPYNYGSIVHYSGKEGTKNGGEKITIKDSSSKQGMIGQNGGRNAQNVDKINASYFGPKRIVTKVPVGKLIALKSDHNTYIHAWPWPKAGAKVDTLTCIGDWERFIIEALPSHNGVFALKTYHNTYLHVFPGGEGSKVDTQMYIGD